MTANLAYPLRAARTLHIEHASRWPIKYPCRRTPLFYGLLRYLNASVSRPPLPFDCLRHAASFGGRKSFGMPTRLSPEITHPDAIGVVDESGVSKSGHETVGVGRQWNGHEGKVASHCLSITAQLLAHRSQTPHFSPHAIVSSTSKWLRRLMASHGHGHDLQLVMPAGYLSSKLHARSYEKRHFSAFPAAAKPPPGTPKISYGDGRPW